MYPVMYFLQNEESYKVAYKLYLNYKSPVTQILPRSIFIVTAHINNDLSFYLSEYWQSVS